MSFQSVISPSASRSPPKKKGGPLAGLNELGGALQINLSLSTVLLLGACLQSLFVLTLPRLYALAPAVLLLILRAIDTALITQGVRSNPYLRGVLPKKTTAQVPSLSGEIHGAGSEKIAVLLLGAKSNHPLGIFAPDFDITNKYLQDMTKELESGLSQEETGFLGQTFWTRQDDNGAKEFTAISYWRSLDDVHKYAHSPLHRKAWQWWEKTISKHGHIGFMHEVFEAPKGKWESVYINFQPTLLGATTYLKKNGKLEGGAVGEEWVSPLIDANRGTMRTSAGRRGVGQGTDNDKLGNNVYV